ncbi:MAG: hypothetical protein DDT26_02051 [Dehalococcoidia bacterium]|nr:hypothetical protein [Chloroflexota bacterium]
MWYKLDNDPTKRMTQAEEREAFARMDRYGFWDGSWWRPSRSSEKRAEARILREGYIIEKSLSDEAYHALRG